MGHQAQRPLGAQPAARSSRRRCRSAGARGGRSAGSAGASPRSPGRGGRGAASTERARTRSRGSSSGAIAAPIVTRERAARTSGSRGTARSPHRVRQPAGGPAAAPQPAVRPSPVGRRGPTSSASRRTISSSGTRSESRGRGACVAMIDDAMSGEGGRTGEEQERIRRVVRPCRRARPHSRRDRAGWWPRSSRSRCCPTSSPRRRDRSEIWSPTTPVPSTRRSDRSSCSSSRC